MRSSKIILMAATLGLMVSPSMTNAANAFVAAPQEQQGTGGAAGVGNDSGAPMTAHVYVGFHLPFPSASYQNRGAGFIVGKELPRQFHLFHMTHDDRELTEQDLLFSSQALRVGIVGHRVAQQLGL